MKNITIGYAVFYFCAIIFLVSCNSASNIFSEQPIKVKKINLEYPSLKEITIYKSFSNAVTNESIQIRAKNKNGNEIIVKVFERYDELVHQTVENNTLHLILSDTSGYSNKIDTFQIKISELAEKIKQTE